MKIILLSTILYVAIQSVKILSPKRVEHALECGGTVN